MSRTASPKRQKIIAGTRIGLGTPGVTPENEKVWWSGGYILSVPTEKIDAK